MVTTLTYRVMSCELWAFIKQNLWLSDWEQSDNTPPVTPFCLLALSNLKKRERYKSKQIFWPFMGSGYVSCQVSCRALSKFEGKIWITPLKTLFWNFEKKFLLPPLIQRPASGNLFKMLFLVPNQSIKQSISHEWIISVI